MSDHYAHQAAVNAAITEVEELRNRLAHAAEQAELTAGAINNAVGEQLNIESARNAWEAVAATLERLNTEIIPLVSQATFELERYRGGF